MTRVLCFWAAPMSLPLELLDSLAQALEFVPEDVRVRHSAMREEAERRTSTQAPGKRAPARTGTHGGNKAADTEKRMAWSAPSTRTARPDSIRRDDLEELAKLTQALESTVSVDELHAIIARARVLAQRHDDDQEIQLNATQVVNAVADRVESLTSTLARSYEPESGDRLADQPTLEGRVVEIGPPSSATAPRGVTGYRSRITHHDAVPE